MHNVLSIQSAVTYGHAGSSSAIFPLQRAGVNVYPVYTVTFSSHTGCGGWYGPMIATPDVADAVTGIDERGALAGVDAVLAGYLGSVDAGQVVPDIAALVKSRNPDAISLADPVMNDVGRGFCARPGIPEFFRDHVAAAADIIALNLFELQYLMGRETGTLSEVIEAACEPRDCSPEIAVVISVVATDTPGGLLRTLAVGASQVWLVGTPALERSFTGSGNLTAAIFLAYWLRTKDLGETLGVVALMVYSVLEQTSASGETELQLVATQEQVVSSVNGFIVYSL